MTTTRQSGFADDNPALVGRERELVALRAALDAALAGRGSLVLIGGEAGIGKTTLAEAICAEAQERGSLVLVGRCYDLAETPPYGPWADLFARAARDGSVPASPIGATQGDGAGPAGQQALFARVRDVLAAAAVHRPLAILLDDLHWADPASLDLLRFLARDLDTLPLLLLATYRADELTRQHPLSPLLPLLVREARAIRLVPRRLEESDLRALLRGRYDLMGTDASRLVTYLASRTEGNPFFVGELLRTLEEGRTLRPGSPAVAAGEAGWWLDDLGSVPLPPLLRQVIDARVDRLGEEARTALEVASVIGQEVSFDLWAAVADDADDVLLVIADRAIQARVIEEVPGGTAIRFAHALIREALYEEIGTLRRRLLHRRAGEALIGTVDPDPDAVAYHFRQAGDPRVGEWLVRAGERAQRGYAWLTAAERYEAALALPGVSAADPIRQALLLLTLAQLRRYVDAARGIPLAAEAEQLARSAGDQNLAAAARFDRGHLIGLTEDNRAGLVEMEAAWPVLADLKPRDRARLPAIIIQGVAPEEDYHRGVLTLWLAAAGRYREALAYGEPFARRAPETTARGLQGLGLANAMLGQPAEVWSSYADARAAYLAAGQHREVANALTQELEWATRYRGDEPGHLAWLADASERANERASGVAVRAGYRFNIMSVLWLSGRWAEAKAVALEVQARGLAARSRYARPWLGRILHARGEPEEAWALVSEALPGGPEGQPAAEFPQALLMYQLAALLALDEGNLLAAQSWLAAHDRGLAWSDAVLNQAESHLGWAAYHRAAGDLTAARAHAEDALAHATQPRQPLALLATHRLLGELATADGRYPDAASALAAALVLAEACAAPCERALTLLSLTELRLAMGEHDGARASLDEGRAILAPLEARPALARADALTARLAAPAPIAAAPALPFGLSAREAEVLRLVAQGLTDAQVADQLFLSPYTVKAHLRSVYNKTGAPSRTAASHLAREHGFA